MNFLTGALAAFVQLGVTICAILVESIQICEIIFNLSQWFHRRCCLKDFLSGAEPFMQF